MGLSEQPNELPTGKVRVADLPTTPNIYLDSYVIIERPGYRNGTFKSTIEAVRDTIIKDEIADGSKFGASSGAVYILKTELEASIQAEAEARAAAIVAEAEARAAAVQAEAEARIAAVQAEAEARIAAINAEAQTRAAQITALTNALNEAVAQIGQTTDSLAARIQDVENKVTVIERDYLQT